MEVKLVSTKQPERHLHLDLDKALVQDRLAATSAVLSAVIHTFPSLQAVISSLQAYDALYSRFCEKLSAVVPRQKLSLKEKSVIQAAKRGLYQPGDVEGTFHSYGGEIGIFALVLFFRESQYIKVQWDTMPEEFRICLVQRVTTEVSSEIVQWIASTTQTTSSVNPYPLQYLGNNETMRRKKNKLGIKGISGANQNKDAVEGAPSTDPTQYTHNMGNFSTSHPPFVASPSNQQSKRQCTTPIFGDLGTDLAKKCPDKDYRQWQVEAPITDRGRDPRRENATNIYDANQQHGTGESIPDTHKPKRTDFGSISTLLNHDNDNLSIEAIPD